MGSQFLTRNAQVRLLSIYEKEEAGAVSLPPIASVVLMFWCVGWNQS